MTDQNGRSCCMARPTDDSRDTEMLGSSGCRTHLSTCCERDVCGRVWRWWGEVGSVLSVGSRRPRPDSAHEEDENEMVAHVFAIDWSGAVKRAERKIWLAEVKGGRLARL